MSGKEQMREQMKALNELIHHNPCGMPDHVYMGMAGVIRFVLSKFKVNRQQAADMFGVTTKTIDRWRKERGLPCDDSNGDKYVSINVDKLLEWKRKNF